MSKTVEFYFDFGSPATYLAWTQLPRLCAESGAQLVYKPMLLGGVFQATGNASPVTIPAKGRFMLQDLARYARRYVVTLSVDQVTFLQPIHVGELVTLLASVNYTGRSSMEIGIKVITENIREQVVRHANSCFFTMVAVGDDGKPAAVAPLEPMTPDQKRRWRAAELRRELRRELNARFAEARQVGDS